jgi:putative restriction endonuclease
MLDYKQKILIEKAARDAGFEIAVAAASSGARFRSSLVPGELTIDVVGGGYRIAIQNDLVMRELIDNFAPQRNDCYVDGNAVVGTGTLALQDLAERIFQLSMALPSKPLDIFRTRVVAMPTTTEAERLVIQRVGQDVFREALDRYWLGKCAVTGVADRALLRASHILPWSQCGSDDQRLDVFNGILLVAHLDAAFDALLMSFDENGMPLFSPRLSTGAAKLLDDSLKGRAISLADRHQGYLQHHRLRFQALAKESV